MAKLLFVQNIDFEFLGPMYIASVLRENGHQCRMTVGKNFNNIKEDIEVFRPDLCAFSIMTGSHKWALGVAQKIRKSYGIECIFGGAHPTFFPEFIKEEGVDILVRGEGEYTCLEIMNAIESENEITNIKNTIVKKNGEFIQNELRNLVTDLDIIPFPDRNLYSSISSRVDKSIINVITSRGCPFHCSFCFEDSMRELYRGKGRYVRFRNPEKVIDELKLLKANSRITTIYFADDIFGMSIKWLDNFLPIFKEEIGLDFICLVRADIVASNPEYAKKLFDAGCKSVFFGIESGDERVRNNILQKKILDKDIYKAADLLHNAGIKFRTYNMLGIPGETLDDAKKTVEMNIKIGTDYPWCSIFMPLPGTKLAEDAVKNGLLPDGFDPDGLKRSFFMMSPLKMDSIKEMENLQKFFQTVVLWPWTKNIVYRIIKFRPNALFSAWFGIVYFYLYLRSEKRKFFKTLFFALANYRHIFARE